MLSDPLISALNEIGSRLAQLSGSIKRIERAEISDESLKAISDQIESAKTAIATQGKLQELMINANVHWRTRKKLRLAHDQALGLAERLTFLESAIAVYDREGSSKTALVSALIFASDDLSLHSSKFLALAKYYEHGQYNSASSSAVSNFDEPHLDRVELNDQLQSNRTDEDFDAPRFSRVWPSDLPFRSAKFRLYRNHIANRESNELQLATLVQVMFATDREPSPTSPPGKVTFLNGRGRSGLSYGVAEVSIPPNHRIGRLERPSIWKLQFAEDSRKHIVITEARTQSLEDWKAAARNRLDVNNEKSALVFIHGFNVSFDEAIRNAAQLGFDLQFPGLVTAYSWCSEGDIASYMTDEENVVLTAPRLHEYFLLLSTQLDIKEIHVVAHSMGNRALVDALCQLSENNKSIGEVVFAAPDIDADVFKSSIDRLVGKAKRYTLYGSENDKALIVSKGVRDGYPRAGDGGANIVVVNGVETIDASAVGDDTLGLGHSYFSRKRTLLTDLYYVIRQSLHPDKRAMLSKHQLGATMYWCFVP